MKKVFCTRFLILTIITLLIGHNSRAQILIREIDGDQSNFINTAVPFLTIVPDARSAGMGNAGVASSPDVNSQHWNVAKYAFIENNTGIAFTHTPWIRAILPSINNFYFSGYKRIDEKSTLSASFRHFTQGEIYGFRPKESAIDFGYSRKLSDHWSAGVVFRYIQSKISDQEESLGTSFSADIGCYYQDETSIGTLPLDIALGFAISNLGTPISYSPAAPKIPIPTTLRVGGKIQHDINDKHTLSLLLDANKLLVPTPPIIEDDIIVLGREASESILSGMIHSFYDAPGVLLEDGSRSVFREEIHEIMLSAGFEYLYNSKYALRTGYFHEHSSKGYGKYLTFGFGLKLKKLGIDASYLFPVVTPSPIQNTYRLMLSYKF